MVVILPPAHPNVEHLSVKKSYLLALPPMYFGPGRQAQTLSRVSCLSLWMLVLLAIPVPHALVDRLLKGVVVSKGLMGQFGLLERHPCRFDIIQLWGVFRQPLCREPAGAVGKRGGCELAGVHRPVVEDQPPTGRCGLTDCGPEIRSISVSRSMKSTERLLREVVTVR